MPTIHVRTSGPLFNGEFGRLVNEYRRELVWEIAKSARGDLGVRFIQKFREPTGYYEAHVQAVHTGYEAFIHDSMVVYGPWLEGTGSRNFPVTRFRGYHSFRTITEMYNRGKAAEVAERVIQPYLVRMGGHPA